ncbi:MAG: hypothetical protein M0T84_10580 [Betaproteobacteria bacterium]|nr:hypothetical protein [Betaproteobacteria bacterium]
MKILEYIDLDTSRVASAYRRVTEAIARDDFRAAQVKKLTSLTHGKFYRARLNDADRLLFSLVRHGNEVCALMLEVIPNHQYDKSRFLRGAAIDEHKLPECDPKEAVQDAAPLRYLHPHSTAVHLLDKPISFDDAQEAIYQTRPPVIVSGSAGSGKTALTLEKLKHAEGEVLYVTLSAYLAQNARNLYYANGFERAGQDATFLSYREFVESIRVPQGRESSWRDFSAWFMRMRQAFKGIEGHQAFEEIRGVITAQPGDPLTRDAYRSLGVRQSIFRAEQRDLVYDLFEKYRAWLGQSGLYDLNLVAHEWLDLAAARYDFVVIDEVQDITPAQLALVLKTLRKAGHFLLCGDSNQIVHPNFFSWAAVKTLFWHDPALAEKQQVRMLAANFRNGQEATRVANQLIKIKQRRFGSIDRESNFLVQAVGAEAGQVLLVADKDAQTKALDQKTRQSTQFAVLVMRDEDKPEARRHFATPLLFSIHEAKGLEYDNIVLYRFVSDHRPEFGEICEGVAKADLAADTLEYRRAREKSDKSLEIYKFFVNALYVAITRAVSNVYLIESDTAHPLWNLLGLAENERVQVETRQSTREDWQREARKLELQGKAEQAEAIRRTLLKETAVPWPIFDEARTRELLVKVFREQVPGAKHRQQLLEVAAAHDAASLAFWLAQEGRFEAARSFERQRASLGRKSYAAYASGHFKDILRQCDQYGLEHRLPMNQTPLMAAAAAGNIALVEALLDRGADPEATDHFGSNALHWAMREAFRDARFAQGSFAALFERLAPAFVDVSTGGRLVRIDRHLSEYFLFQTCWALFKGRFTDRLHTRGFAAFDTQTILAAWAHLPANVVRPDRNRRAHLSNVLSRNEVERAYAYNRALFRRLAHGLYQLNPKLLVRRKVEEEDTWMPAFQALNLPFISAFAWDIVGQDIDTCLREAGLPDRTTPVVAERALARGKAARQERAEREARPAQPPAKWGTPEAKRLELARVRQEIEAKKKG